ncbi:MAG: c-type cytochrome [Gallionella sp.]
MNTIKVLCCALMLLFAITAKAEPHAQSRPIDYLLKADVVLSSGQILPAGTRWYQPPNIKRLKSEVADGKYQGESEWASKVVFGYSLVYETYFAIGEGRKDGKPPLAKGRIMNCTNCHAQSGIVPYAWPFFRTLTFYGLREEGDKGIYFGNLAYHRDARTRARDCGRECGGSVMIEDDSYEMDALMAWLKAVRDGIYPDEGLLIEAFKTKIDFDKIPGGQIPLFASVLDMKSDPVAGKEIYKNRCQRCHGADGLGQWSELHGYVFPPLAGDSSFSHAGGPMMIPIGAAFLHQNMPLSKPGSLSQQDALNVMGYVARFSRSSVWWQSYYFRHDPCSRPAFLPLHVGAIPKEFPFSNQQAQFGPWRPIALWLSSNDCKKANPPSSPQLDRDFDTQSTHRGLQ